MMNRIAQNGALTPSPQTLETLRCNVRKNRFHPGAGFMLLAALLILWTGPAWAEPHNPTVPSGRATIQQNGTTTTVTQWSQQAIVNWQKFGVSANELVKFIQPNALATLLNRVTGVSPSVILGSIQANGRIFIVNPNGIVFGNGATIDVGSLLATTL